MLNQGWQSSAISHKGNIRNENQDAFLLDDANQLWLVADGMGGGKAGALASSMLMKSFENISLEETLPERIKQLETLVFSANRSIYDYAQQTFVGAYMGTTLVLLNKWRDLGILVWVGDSRCYGQKAHEISCFSWDHNQATELMKLGQISEEDMRKMSRSNAITRAVGLHVNVHPEFKLIEMAAWQSCLLCSDGIYTEVSEAQILSCFSSKDSAKNKLAQIQSAVLKAGAKDNLTLVCVYPDALSRMTITPGILALWNNEIEQLQFSHYIGDITYPELISAREMLFHKVEKAINDTDDLSTVTLNAAQVKQLNEVNKNKKNSLDPMYLRFSVIILIILVFFILTLFGFFDV